MKTLPVDYLNSILVCDKVAGKLYWKHREDTNPQWNGRYAGTEAFTAVSVAGYKVGRINRSVYLAHRIIWAMTHGEWPSDEIDHINGITTDNTEVNLRLASRRQNMRNLTMNVRNTSGFKGVSWDKGCQKWRASIAVNLKNRYLGVFLTQEEAQEAYVNASLKLHGRFGKPYG